MSPTTYRLWPTTYLFAAHQKQAHNNAEEEKRDIERKGERERGILRRVKVPEEDNRMPLVYASMPLYNSLTLSQYTSISQIHLQGNEKQSPGTPGHSTLYTTKVIYNTTFSNL